MSVFTRAAFSALFLAVFFSLPAVVAEREAEAEAKATAMVSEAIARGDVNAVNYFLGQAYVEAFAKLAESDQQRTVIIPAEFSSLIGTLEGIKGLTGNKGD